MERKKKEYYDNKNIKFEGKNLNGEGEFKKGQKCRPEVFQTYA